MFACVIQVGSESGLATVGLYLHFDSSACMSEAIAICKFYKAADNGALSRYPGNNCKVYCCLSVVWEHSAQFLFAPSNPGHDSSKHI